MIEILPILFIRRHDTDVIGRPRDDHASLRRKRVNKTEIDRDPCANNNEQFFSPPLTPPPDEAARRRV